MKTFRFLDFPVYIESRVFYQEVMVLMRKLSREHRELADQMRRSSLSILLNIAEGSAKKSDKDFNRYIENALGSINETVAGFDVCRCEGILSTEEFKLLLFQAENITKQLGGFSKFLKRTSPSH